MSTLRETLDGFPVWQMTVICLVRFSEPIVFTSMFPYVYFMVRDFGIAKDEADISKYTGYLSAAFAFCQFLLCVQWSRLSDVIGRKPVLLGGLFGTGAMIFLFGFSWNFTVAILARSIMGALNGNIAVLRTMVGEVATERRHQAIAFTSLPLLWGLGSIVGPLIGGSKYLTKPPTSVKSLSWSSSYEHFLDTYPYALSNIVVGGFQFVSMLIAFLFLEETHKKFKNRRDLGLDIGDFIRRSLGFKVPPRPWKKNQTIKNKELSDEITPLLVGSDITTTNEESDSVSINSDDDNVIDPFSPTTRRLSSAILSRYTSNPVEDVITPTVSRTSTFAGEPSGFNRDTFTIPVIETIVANFLLSFQNMVFSEFVPVLLAGDFLGDKLQFPFKITGGFGYTPQIIGTLFSVTGLLGVFVVLFLFPLVDRLYSTLIGYRVATAVLPLVYFVLPLAIFTVPEYNPSFPPWVTLALVYVLAGFGGLAFAIAYPQIFILNHRASPPQHRALINGTVLSATSLARTIAPLAWGNLISLCDSYNVGEVSWWLLSIMAIGGCVQALIMNEHDEDLKEVPLLEESGQDEIEA
ncbi:hypothetical protein CAAN1_20S01090 [[Candida] anglica]|uniref:Major facilitator superfamily (MFS) profile domain-containing protein n=1 Tax=[Candida] anglica TaxID=148631 RepID=A0ABP0EFS4_9ASCO